MSQDVVFADHGLPRTGRRSNPGRSKTMGLVCLEAPCLRLAVSVGVCLSIALLGLDAAAADGPAGKKPATACVPPTDTAGLLNARRDKASVVIRITPNDLKPVRALPDDNYPPGGSSLGFPRHFRSSSQLASLKQVDSSRNSL